MKVAISSPPLKEFNTFIVYSPNIEEFNAGMNLSISNDNSIENVITRKNMITIATGTSACPTRLKSADTTACCFPRKNIRNRFSGNNEIITAVLKNQDITASIHRKDGNSRGPGSVEGNACFSTPE